MIALLSLVGVLVGAALQYAFGRRLESRKQLTAQKAQAYIDFFRSVASLSQARSSEMLATAADAKTRICMYGSAAVIKELAAFEAAGSSTFTHRGRTAILEVLIAMREDLRDHRQSIDGRDLEQVLFGAVETAKADDDQTNPRS